MTIRVTQSNQDQKVEKIEQEDKKEEKKEDIEKEEKEAVIGEINFRINFFHHIIKINICISCFSLRLFFL